MDSTYALLSFITRLKEKPVLDSEWRHNARISLLVRILEALLMMITLLVSLMLLL